MNIEKTGDTKMTERIEYLTYLKEYTSRILELENNCNNIYIKREDDIPYSFGGNKVRIAANYLIDALEKEADTIITYGSSSSNLCRILVGLCKKLGLRIIIISPDENYEETTNSNLVRKFGAKVVRCPLEKVSITIDKVIEEESKKYCPYFIYGGGHGIIGTDSYRCVYKQILDYEKINNINFDYIFITCGTGTSMSGLIVENMINNNKHHIIGVTIAREKDKVVNLMGKSVENYLSEKHISLSVEKEFEITDTSRCDGYGRYNLKIIDAIKRQYIENGLNLDTTYTGKGFSGMLDYIEKVKIKDKNILFIYTGGTPLFFNDNCKWLKEAK